MDFVEAAMLGYELQDGSQVEATFEDTDDPIWILGQEYHADKGTKALKKTWVKKILPRI